LGFLTPLGLLGSEPLRIYRRLVTAYRFES
jgi:hypothetical protein